jgi:hypothetical protein
MRSVISESCDNEVIGFITEESTNTSQVVLSKYFGVAVLQNVKRQDIAAESLQRFNPTIRIHKTSTGVPATFVDRSCPDLAIAAAHLRKMVLQCPRQQSSPRIPRICFVDEFIVQDLADMLGALVSYGAAEFDSVPTSNEGQGSKEPPKKPFPSRYMNGNLSSTVSVRVMESTP